MTRAVAIAGLRPADRLLRAGAADIPQLPALTLPSSASPSLLPGNRQIKSPEVYLADAANPPYVQWLLLLQPITEHVDIHLRLRRPIRP